RHTEQSPAAEQDNRQRHAPDGLGRSRQAPDAADQQRNPDGKHEKSDPKSDRRLDSRPSGRAKNDEFIRGLVEHFHERLTVTAWIPSASCSSPPSEPAARQAERTAISNRVPRSPLRPPRGEHAGPVTASRG